MTTEAILGSLCESNGKVSSIRIWLVLVTLMVFIPWIILTCQHGRIESIPIIPGILPVAFAVCKVWQRGKEGLK
jgi:hypothetical protein